MRKATLILEDGTQFHGRSFGADQPAAGEVVFNTAMTGYTESLTDPSYAGQLMTLTYPLAGNYGVPSAETRQDNMPLFMESDKIHATALIVSDYSEAYSHWNAKESLGDWLKREGVTGITGIDTRELTKTLRERGVMMGKIILDDEPDNVPEAQYEGVNYVAQVSCKEIITYNEGAGKRAVLVDCGVKNNIIRCLIKRGIEVVRVPWDAVNYVAKVSCQRPIRYNAGEGRKRVVLVDCGAKNNIIRCLTRRGVEVVRVPWDYDFNTLEFDGLFLANGPGDPDTCVKTVENIRRFLASPNVRPCMGICMGNQLLSKAAGASIYKLKYGHRSHNQPVRMVGNNRCFVTSQNHGYAVDTNTLPADWEPLFINMNDGSNEGVKHKSNPWFSAQFHPEACSGPVDTEFLFDDFAKLL